jgi:hypothetical protein
MMVAWAEVIPKSGMGRVFFLLTPALVDEDLPRDKAKGSTVIATNSFGPR